MSFTLPKRMRSICLWKRCDICGYILPGYAAGFSIFFKPAKPAYIFMFIYKSKAYSLDKNNRKDLSANG